jgi:hypothetical protein
MRGTEQRIENGGVSTGMYDPLRQPRRFRKIRFFDFSKCNSLALIRTMTANWISMNWRFLCTPSRVRNRTNGRGYFAGRLEANASMSACIRCLYSSDHSAPGFWLALLCGRGTGGLLTGAAALRGPVLSLRVNRDGVGSEFD